ncbi:large ribosomal subunit protein mL52-like [Clavelina lepadiformis]|uniref:large ribosomal subunit protein mL52-like n=1 Tax=Clavelina lepadiformis TaxID=159417 RepID=UPI004042FF29
MALVVFAEHCSRCLFQQNLPVICRTISTTQLCFGRLKKGDLKKERGLNKGYGPMVDTPDWSYADGRPAPPGVRATARREIQKQICRRIIELNSDINRATNKVSSRKRLFVKHVGMYKENRFKERSEK